MDVVAFLAWLIPVVLLVYLCWTSTQIMRGLGVIMRRGDDASGAERGLLADE